ncbi:hypothetical protein V8G54_036146, partial [Vigna mungo]
ADLKLYNSIVGALHCPTITRSELVFSVNKVCQYMHQPEHHWKVGKQILRYLTRTKDHGLLHSSSNLCHYSFVDFDWVTKWMIKTPFQITVFSLTQILFNGSLKNKKLYHEVHLKHYYSLS